MLYISQLYIKVLCKAMYIIALYAFQKVNNATKIENFIPIM